MLSLVPLARRASRNLSSIRADELTTIGYSVSCVCRVPSLERQYQGIFFISRRDETLCERIIEHVLYIPTARTIVEKAELVPYCALVHLSQLFARHKRSIFIFEGLPVSC